MFGIMLYNLRSQGIKVGTAQWLTLMKALREGLVTYLDDLYGLGRSIFCSSHEQFDAYDIAFSATFNGIELPKDISDEILGWLAKELDIDGELVQPDIDIEQLWEEFYKRLQEQEEEHNGGSRWIGTGGTSPFGHSGRASHGIRVGGASRNRSAVSIASQRQWSNYRTDTALQSRDFHVALKQLRRLTPEGEFELNIDKTIRKTTDNGGEIELAFARKKTNRIKLVLLMDSGGSMEPHARRVEQLFSVASEMKGFHSFEAWHFHNVPYGHLYKDYYSNDKKSIMELIQEWTPKHRFVWVGDASMAPYELLSTGWNEARSGLDWLKLMRRSAPYSIWLNPDPIRFWDHPTVRAIQTSFDMFPLTVDGLRSGVKRLLKTNT